MCMWLVFGVALGRSWCSCVSTVGAAACGCRPAVSAPMVKHATVMAVA